MIFRYLSSLNACSSRSHVIIMVQVQKRDKSTIIAHRDGMNSLDDSLVQYKPLKTTATDESESPKRKTLMGGSLEKGVSLVTSVLYLVDLAGSERVKKSKYESMVKLSAEVIFFLDQLVRDCTKLKRLIARLVHSGSVSLRSVKAVLGLSLSASPSLRDCFKTRSEATLRQVS